MSSFGASADPVYDDSVIDTLQAARAFRGAGFTEAQADVVLRTMKQAVEGDLVTKADLQVARADLRSEVQAVRTEVQTLRADLYRHLWVMAAGIVGMTVALTKLLP